MEDDEDLEFLRLAALKSLNNKKDAELPHISPPSRTHLLNGNVNHINPIGESARQLVSDYYSATMPTLPFKPPPLNEFIHTVGPHLHSNFEKIDLNDAYGTQIGNTMGGNVLNEYKAPFGTKPTSNVQLSPRSAAFVLQNNDILMRRKSGRSPDSLPRSHSPIPYRKSPGRWSPTPPPMAKSRSPKRSPSYGYQRTHSPPMLRRTSPYTRNRSISRSPQRRRHSPFPIHPRRSKSRSPLPRNVQTNYRPPPRPRSPILHGSNASNSRRATSPPIRNASRVWRGNSPAPAAISRNNSNQNRRSMSPRVNDEPGNYRPQVRRRSRSPLNNKIDVRRRSNSRSPGRKNQRNTGVRRRRSPSPLQPQKLNQRNSNNPSRNNGPVARNRLNNTRRSVSPPNNPHHRRSKSRSPKLMATQQTAKPEILTENKDAAKQEQTKATKKEENSSSDDRTMAANESNKMDAKTEQQIEDELLASTNDEHSDSESDNDDDGIDLFASEESESENEGRFKLSSRQTEKPSAAVPFSKLGTTASTELRELEELRGDKASSASRKNGRDERERERERGGTRNVYRREPNGRYGGRKQGTDTKTRDRDSNRSWKGSKSESRRKDIDADIVASEKERKPILFKSTFQAVDTETHTKTPDAGN